jgi:hypothetical protein
LTITFIDKEEFEKWMRRILDRLDILENKITKKKKTRYTVNGELLYDNQDICVMMNISKRTLQRFRSSGRLPYRRIDQKTFYLESDVKNFIQEYMKSSKDKPKDETESDT